MICIRMKGRMGNQLFQLAFAEHISEVTGDTIGIDWKEVNSRHKAAQDGWGNSLGGSKIEHIQEISTESMCSRFQLRLLEMCTYITYHRYLKIFLPVMKFLAQFAGVYICLDDRYFPYIYFGAKNKLVYGYFESDRYFPKETERIKQRYVKRGQTDNPELLKKIVGTESVCVTIRRGDFFTKENAENLGVCNADYYYRGIDYIQKIHKDAVVFFFSDDIEWVRENIKIDGPAFYESGKDALWEKLLLMSSCKHFVISNSTFSWWAQYLSHCNDKIVIAPRRWRANDKRYEIKQDNWVIM